MITIIFPESSKNIFDLLIEVSPIVISVWAIIISYKANISAKKINDLNLNATYHNKIFDEFLIDELPLALSNIKHLDEKFLDDNSMLEECLGKLISKILFFKYKNLSFYNELSKHILILEDKIVNNYNRQMKAEEYNLLKKEIENLIVKIYDTIEKNYIGKE